MAARNYHLRYKARNQLTAAIASGDVVRPDTCQRCHERCYVEGHHPDYALPVYVVWLCKQCHTQEHVSLRRRMPKAIRNEPVPTIADRAVLAARRQRDRAAATVARWDEITKVVPDTWTLQRYTDAVVALEDAERTVAELERGAGVPIAADEGEQA